MLAKDSRRRAVRNSSSGLAASCHAARTKPDKAFGEAARDDKRDASDPHLDERSRGGEEGIGGTTVRD